MGVGVRYAAADCSTFWLKRTRDRRASLISTSFFSKACSGMTSSKFVTKISCGALALAPFTSPFTLSANSLSCAFGL